MADEAVVLHLDSDIQYFTVADGTAIAKGSILVIGSDPRTAVAHTAGDEVFLGVTVEDKVASDGQTRLAARCRGIFDIKAKSSVTLGDYVMLSPTANQVDPIEAGALSGKRLRNIVGICLETASAAEVVQIWVR